MWIPVPCTLRSRFLGKIAMPHTLWKRGWVSGQTLNYLLGNPPSPPVLQDPSHAGRGGCPAPSHRDQDPGKGPGTLTRRRGGKGSSLLGERCGCWVSGGCHVSYSSKKKHKAGLDSPEKPVTIFNPLMSCSARCKMGSGSRWGWVRLTGKVWGSRDQRRVADGILNVQKQGLETADPAHREDWEKGKWRSTLSRRWVVRTRGA